MDEGHEVIDSTDYEGCFIKKKRKKDIMEERAKLLNLLIVLIQNLRYDFKWIVSVTPFVREYPRAPFIVVYVKLLIAL